MQKGKVPNGWKLITYGDVEKVSSKQEEEERNSHKLLSKLRLIFFPTKEEKLFVNPFYEFNKSYIKRNIFPFLLEVVFVLFCLFMPVKHFIYVRFGFFFLLYIFFVITKRFSISAWITNLRDGIDFWKDVCVTSLLFGAAKAITEGMVDIVPSVNPVFIPTEIRSGVDILLFAITTMYLGPIVEEIYFREGLICNHSRIKIVLSTILSMALFSIKYAFSPWGIFLVMIWALPLTWAYVKTGNVYICITSHFIVNFIGNIPLIIANMIQ